MGEERLLFSYRGKPRRLLSISEARDGTVFITPPRLKFADPFYQETVNRLPQTHKKYSIHPSSNNPSFNFIKLTQNVGGREETLALQTSAIKRDRNFCHLFSSALAAFSSSEHDYSKPGKDLGFDTAYCQPLFHVVVCGPDKDPYLDHFRPFRLWVSEFEKFKIIILFSFFPFAAWLESRTVMNNFTPKDSVVRNFLRPSTGENEVALVSSLRMLEAGLRVDLFDWAKFDLGLQAKYLSRDKFQRLKPGKDFPRHPLEQAVMKECFLKQSLGVF